MPPAQVCPATSAPSQTSPHSASITPLPHSISPSPLQPSQSAVLPSSHSSPQSTTPLPTTSRVQAVEHPSQSLVLPSSHCSPASSTPSPQRDGDPGRVVVVAVQGPDVKAAQALQSRKDPPGEVQSTSPSQTSPGSTVPSPHRAGGGSVVLVVVVLVRGVPAGRETMLRRSRMSAATRRPSTSTLLPRRRLANGAQSCAPMSPWREKRTRSPATNTWTLSGDTPASGSGESCTPVLAAREPATSSSLGPVKTIRARRDARRLHSP